MISTLHLPGEFADTWGDVYARLAARMAPLADSVRFRPRLYCVPQWKERIIQRNGYVKATMVVTPGSFIWGLLYAAFFQDNGQTLGVEVTNLHFVFQVTDVALKHKWFSEPVPCEFFKKSSSLVPICFGQSSKLPWLLESPYPVTGSGLFVVEFWNTTSSDPDTDDVLQRWCQMAFGVAEPRVCNG